MEPIDGEYPGHLFTQTAIYDNMDLTNDLLQGAEREFIDARDPAMERTAVFTAVVNDSLSVLKTLLEAGADPNIPCSSNLNDYEDMTPLHVAASKDTIVMLQLLLKHGAHSDVKDIRGDTPLDIARRKKGAKKHVELLQNSLVQLNKEIGLLKEQAKPVIQDLYLCCGSGNLEKTKELIQELLDRKLRIQDFIDDIADNSKQTLLYWACQSKNISLVRYLIELGATGKVHLDQFESPLHAAAKIGSVAMTKLLLQHFPALSGQATCQGLLPIHIAVQEKWSDVIHELLNYNYDNSVLSLFQCKDKAYMFAFNMNAQDDSTGMTPFSLACKVNDKNIIMKLLDFKVEEYKEEKNDVKNVEGPVHVQKFCPIDLDIADNTGFTPLHNAVQLKQYNTVDTLSKHGANLSAKVNSKGKVRSKLHNSYTPLMLAFEQDVKMMDILLSHGAQDTENKVMFLASCGKCTHAIQTLLKHKGHSDTEYKFNKKALLTFLHQIGQNDDEQYLSSGIKSGNLSDKLTSLGYGPKLHPVVVDWHKVGLGGTVEESWILSVCSRINPGASHSSLGLLAITRIDISDNAIEALPDFIFLLPSLKILNASKNTITTVADPYESSDSSAVKNSLVDTFGHDSYCPVLEDLNLSGNKISNVPLFVFRMLSLSKLDVSHNRLASLPPEMWNAPKLSELNLSHNQLSSLPLLSEVWVDTKPLLDPTDSTKTPNMDERQAFVKKQKVREYSEKDNLLEEFWRGNFPVTSATWEDKNDAEISITELDLSHNKFEEVPAGLSCLAPSLSKLNLSHNLLEDLGSPHAYPATLSKLDVSNNKLLTTLIKQESLSWSILPSCSSMSNNSTCYRDTENMSPGPKRPSTSSLSSLGCRHQLHDRWPAVKTLKVSHNSLRDLKLVFSSQDNCENTDEGDEKSQRLLFPILSTLDASNNKLESIPKTMSQNVLLSWCSLQNNNIKELPFELGVLEKLWFLDVKGNPLEGHLKTMVEQKKRTVDILGYLHSVLEESKPYTRLKMMFVGKENIGKTSLLRLLKKRGTTGSVDVNWSTRNGREDTRAAKNKPDMLSTVGVDIGEITWKKKIGKEVKEVTFKTWDFGGQKEYYATHQYFLSQRSLYLVLWKVTDAEKGVNGMMQWLVNIQARAPSSPVIIVGTHLDEYNNSKKNFPKDFLKDMRRRIDKMYINHPEPSKCGLPNVIRRIEVSCQGKGSHIDDLEDIIWKTVFELKRPGTDNKLLLEELIPAKYINLEKVIIALAEERRRQGKDPVLHKDQYKTLVSDKLLQMYNKSFRDPAEIAQATQFLHENGILLYYKDASLQDTVFLDPQWLCDMLAHVVTIREINQSKNGIMKIDNIPLLFKSSAFSIDDIRTYVVSLLSKFEVALLFDDTHLLVPSLLPSEIDIKRKMAEYVKVTVKEPGWLKKTSSFKGTSTSKPSKSIFYVKSPDEDDDEELEDSIHKQISLDENTKHVKLKSNPLLALNRLYILTYFPSGFWPRLLTRLLGEGRIHSVVKDIYQIPECMSDDPINKVDPYWCCWQTGMKLLVFNSVVLNLREVNREGPSSKVNYYEVPMYAWREDDWVPLELENMAVLEIRLPNNSLKVYQHEGQEVIIPTNPRAVAKLMSIVVDVIDALLVDWYPDIGTRFAQKMNDGLYLVTRVIPCPRCLEEEKDIGKARSGSASATEWAWVEKTIDLTAAVEVDSVDLQNDETERFSNPGIYCFLVESVIFSNENPVCKEHNEVVNFVSDGESIHSSHVAPDLKFLDLLPEQRIQKEQIEISKFLGRGGFGFVFAGKVTWQKETKMAAMKMIEPYDPGENASYSLKEEFLAAERKWAKEPEIKTSMAYLTLRQEQQILNSLKHDHIVSLIGVSLKPLCLILELAPQGDVEHSLKNYKRNGSRIPLLVMKNIIYQVSSAINYLHSNHIIYCDLKSENVLVWSLPLPGDDLASVNALRVDVRLADYGVSRTALSNVAKGFAGTPGFMAPEILEYGGDETYTEKVDCFSFGMFIYELITMSRPFSREKVDSLGLRDYILEGNRPSLTDKEVASLPTNLLNMMAWCWLSSPTRRPSMANIMRMVDMPDFLHLKSVARTNTSPGEKCSCACTVPGPLIIDGYVMEDPTCDIWICNHTKGNNLCTSLDVYQHNTSGLSSETIKSIALDDCKWVTAVCGVEDDQIWCCSDKGILYVISSQEYKILHKSDILAQYDKVYATEIIYMMDKKQVLVLLTSGMTLICDPFRQKDIKVVAHLPGTGQEVYCIAYRENELWCGQTNEQITVWSMDDVGMDTPLAVLTHTQEKGQEESIVYLLNTESGQAQFAWSYIYPGCTVWQWNIAKRSVSEKLNVSKLIPVDDLKTGNYPGYRGSLNPEKCQVKILNVLNEHLYIGTLWGCIIVCNKITMEPTRILRPYENEDPTFMHILPVNLPKVRLQFENDDVEETTDNNSNMVITFGNGCRSSINNRRREKRTRSPTYILSWDAKNWDL